jgi:hypothetical protein
MFSRIVREFCFGLLFAVTLTGCGTGDATVTGKVTYKGKAVESGTVTFFGESNVTKSSIISADGKYSITIAPGPVKISIVGPPAASGSSVLKMDPSKFGTSAPAPAKSKEAIRIPERYADPQKSGQSYTVKAGSQEYDLKLD